MPKPFVVKDGKKQEKQEKQVPQYKKQILSVPRLTAPGFVSGIKKRYGETISPYVQVFVSDLKYLFDIDNERKKREYDPLYEAWKRGRG